MQAQHERRGCGAVGDVVEPQAVSDDEAMLTERRVEQHRRI
jgi:hypothetical protein